MLDRRQGLKAAMAFAGMAAAGRSARAAAPAMVALSEQRDRFLVAVSVNGVAGYRFVLDTGSTTHFISSRLAEDLRLPAVGRRMVRAYDGRRPDGVIEIDRLNVGGVDLGRTRAIVWAAERLGEYDGLIGYPFLFPRAVLTLGAAQLSLGGPAPGALTPVRAEVMRNRTLLIGGLAGAEGRFVFDTGAQACTISPTYFRRIAGGEAYRAAAKLTGEDAGSQSDPVAFRPAELAFGALRIADPVVRIGREDGREGVFQGVDGLFGVSLIRRYAWALDQTAGSLHAGPHPS